MSEQATIREHLLELKASMSWAVCHDAPFSLDEIRRLEDHVEGALALMDKAATAIDAYEDERPDYRVVYDPDPGAGAGSSLPGAPTTKETTT